jgi:hypothetical protein
VRDRHVELLLVERVSDDAARQLRAEGVERAPREADRGAADEERERGDRRRVIACRCAPGFLPSTASASERNRCSGTNRSFATTELLPVPVSPVTYQSSWIATSLAGASQTPVSGGPPAPSLAIVAPRITQRA